MHQYLNAIGFGSMKSKKELYEILDKVEQQYTCHELVYQDEELDFCEYQKEFGPGMGICLCGDMDSVDNYEKILLSIFSWNRNHVLCRYHD